MGNTVDEPARMDWPRALWGVVLSIVVPGLGHIYARSWRLGVILLAIGICLVAGIRLQTRAVPPLPTYFVSGLGLILCSLVFALGTASDAARRMRRRRDRPRPAWYCSTWPAAVVSSAVTIGLAVAMPFGWRSFSIPSGSNLPNILVGDVIVADVRDPGVIPDRGDVVLFKYPRDPSVTYIKRLVGLPGDVIQRMHGQLSVNGQPVPRQAAGEFVSDDGEMHTSYKRYIEVLPNGRRYAVLQATDIGSFKNTAAYRVPADAVFVLGDNRDNSVDSRMALIGYIPVRNLIGKASTVYWSSDHARIFSRIE